MKVRPGRSHISSKLTTRLNSLPPDEFPRRPSCSESSISNLSILTGVVAVIVSLTLEVGTVFSKMAFAARYTVGKLRIKSKNMVR